MLLAIAPALNAQAIAAVIAVILKLFIRAPW
jgi:hypothetical protein